MDVDLFGVARVMLAQRRGRLGALRFAWALMGWEQRMAFRVKYPALARELSRRG